MRFEKSLIIVSGIILALSVVSCGGGGGKVSPMLGGINSSQDNNAGSEAEVGGTQTSPASAIEISGGYLTDPPRTEIDPEYVLVKTGDSPEEFKKVASKYHYEVIAKNGNWITLRVPDRDIERALTELKKEYTVFSAEPLYKYVMPRPSALATKKRLASFLPADPLYADRNIGPDPSFQTDQNGNPLYSTFWGQRVYMAPMGFEGAWDIALLPAVRIQPVVVAVIGAGIAPNQFDIDTARIHSASGTIAADGTFTQGSYNWEVDANQNPYDPWGGRITGLFLSQFNNVNGFNFTTGNPPVTWNWLSGMAPLTPFAQVMIIKTGELQGSNWVFTSAHLANSINHAVTNGANIIVIATWAVGSVPLEVQDAVDNARNNNVLVIAPAGESTLNDNGTPNDITDDFWNPPVDVSTITPASANGVISVGGTGFEQIDFGVDPAPPAGYANRLIPNIGNPWWKLDEFSNTGVDIAAVGWGLSWEDQVFFGYFSAFGPSFANIGTGYSAGYVAGAAAIMYQALTNANGGTPPADVDQVIEDLLYSSANTEVFDTTGVQSGFLQAGLACALANNGGWNQVLTPVDITNVQISGGFFIGNTAFIETNQEVQFAVSMTSSAGGYELAVGWGDGTSTPENGTPAPYNPGDPISHTYTEAGSYVIYFIAEDAGGYSDVFAVYAEVYDGLSATPTILKQDLSAVTGNPPQLGYTEIYLMDAKPQYRPITGNIVTFDWDFDWDGDPNNFTVDVANKESFLFTYGPAPNPPNPAINYLGKDPDTAYTIGLRVTQTRRPTLYFQIDVNVGS